MLVMILFFLTAYAYDAILVIIGVNTVIGSRLFLPVLIFLCYWFACAACQSPKKFVDAIKLVILIHCLFFLAQFLVFLFSGYLIDYLEPITGESQRALGGNYEIAILPNFIRATGLYNEPGTYSTYLMLFLVFSKDLEKIAGFRSIGKPVELLVLITVMLSFSNFGFIFVGFYLFFSFFANTGFSKRSGFQLSKFLFNIFLMAAILFCGFIFYEYFQQRFFSSSSESGIEFRIFGLMNVLTNVDWVEMLFGKGFSAPVETYDGVPLPIQDIGFWFGIIYHVGLVGAIVMSLCIFSSIPGFFREWSANSYFFCLVVFLLLCKLGFTNPIVLIVLAYASVRGVVAKRNAEQNLLV